jgi:hypothetical protein
MEKENDSLIISLLLEFCLLKIKANAIADYRYTRRRHSIRHPLLFNPNSIPFDDPIQFNPRSRKKKEKKKTPIPSTPKLRMRIFSERRIEIN